MDAIRKEIPDWDARVEKERLKQTLKEAPSDAKLTSGPNPANCDNVTVRTDTGGGNRVEYLAARLKRDAPEIAKRLERGEFKSVRSAAKAAGIVKDKSQIEIARQSGLQANVPRIVDLTPS